jgi:hypothetical protein
METKIIQAYKAIILPQIKTPSLVNLSFRPFLKYEIVIVANPKRNISISVNISGVFVSFYLSADRLTYSGWSLHCRQSMTHNASGIDRAKARWAFEPAFGDSFLRDSERYCLGKKCEQIDRNIYAIK